MLLYWGMFTVGFLFGSVLAFVTFAPKKPEDDPEYGERPIKDFEGLSGAIEGKKFVPEMFFPQNLEKSPNPKIAFSKKVPAGRKIFLTN